MARSPKRQLAAYQARYRELAAAVTELGYISAGSLAHVTNRCGKPNCRCHADPPQLHGPYWQWTTKVGGKTVTRRLTDDQARLYQDWIGNDRHLRALISQMREVSAKATELIMKQAG